jgi:hypothetical protein
MTAPHNLLLGNSPHLDAAVIHTNIAKITLGLLLVTTVSMDLDGMVTERNCDVCDTNLCESNTTMDRMCCRSPVFIKQNNLPVTLQKDAPATDSVVIVRSCPLTCATSTGGGPPALTTVPAGTLEDVQQQVDVMVSHTHCLSTTKSSSQS